MLRALLSGLKSLFRRPQLNRDLDDELQHYLEQLTREKMRAGLARAAAERAARIELGGVEVVKEQVRSSGWEGVVGAFVQDVRYALRGLRRHPGFSAIAVGTLALGIGLTTSMFSVVHTVMLRPLPYADARELLLVFTDDVRRGLHQEPTSYRTIMDWRTRSQVFEDVAYFWTHRMALLSNDPAAPRDRARVSHSSGNLFEVLGARPLMGRTLTASDEGERSQVAVISHAFWQRWFGGAPDVVGRTVRIDDNAKGGMATLTVVGVMPAGFFFPDKLTELWLPSTTYWRFERESGERFPEYARRWTALARLAAGYDVPDARTDLQQIGRDLTLTFPSDVPDFPGFTATVLPMLDSIAGAGLQSALWLLLGATLLVLLVACANVANLLLARGATRQSEFAVRRALGGGRFRLLRLLAAENLTLAGIGGALGLLIAWWSTKLLSATASNIVPRQDEIALDANVLLFALLASLAAALVFGFAPAWRLSRVDLSQTLKEGGRGNAGGRIGGVRGLVVLAECCAAIILLAGAGLLLRSLHRLNAVDPGYQPSGVLTMRLEFGADPPPSAAEIALGNDIGPARARAREQQMEDLLARLNGLAGVQRAAFIDDLFVTGTGNDAITIPGRPELTQAAGQTNAGNVSPAFFELMRVPLRRGRYLTREDAAQKIRALWSPIIKDMPLEVKQRLAAAEPVVVNEAFVKRYFPNEDPIGKRFCVDPTNKTYWFEIVGVVGDMHRQGLEREAIAEFYSPHYPNAGGRSDLLVRARSNEAALAMAPAIRQEVQRAFPGVSIVTVSTVDAQLGNFTAQRNLQTFLLTGFAALALLLAAIGVFGLVHYAVAERTREIGVRMALGASPTAVLGLLVKEGMRMPVLGIVAGLAVALALSRLIASLLFGISANDPLTFVLIALVLTTVAALACYIAARRAIRGNPLDALR